MIVALWVAFAWLAATTAVLLAFYGARHSSLLYTWLFGERPSADIVSIARMSVDADSEQPVRLVA